MIEFWDDLIDAYEVASADGKAMWFAVVHPKLSKATFYKGEPAPIGFNEAEVGSMAETTLYITPNSAPIMDTKPSA